MAEDLSFDFVQVGGRYFVVTAPDGSVVSQHTDLAYAQEAVLNHALDYYVDGTYRIERNAAWEITTVGFKARSKNPGDVLPPTVPVVTAIQVGQTDVRLNWTASTDVSGVYSYLVQRVGDATVHEVLSPTRQYTYTGIGSVGQALTFTVKSKDIHGNVSAPGTSNTVTVVDVTPPTVPVLSVSTASSTSLLVSWTASADDSPPITYVLDRSLDQTNWVQIRTQTTTSYTDTGLAPSTRYYYRVLAYDSRNNTSAHSTTASGTTSASSTNGTLLLFDGFDYQVDKTESTTTAEPKFIAAGWSACKRRPTAANSFYLWTVTQAEMQAACGYTGSLPGGGARCLKVEADSVNGETGRDVYLQIGNGSVPNTIPADVWFQWWQFIPWGGSEQSQLEKRHKILYPTNNGYPSNSDKWLVSVSGHPYSKLAFNGSYPSSMGDLMPFDANGDNVSDQGQSFLINRDFNGAAVMDSQYNTSSIGPNQQTLNNSYAPSQEWVLHKVHLDTSTANGKFEHWMKVRNGSWRKISEWIGGTTPQFTYSVSSPGGHSMMRFLTTIFWTNWSPTKYYWLYIDDFAMATSEAALPTYDNNPSLLFFDDFNYAVARGDSTSTKQSTFGSHGWGIKDNSEGFGPGGWIYTTSSIPGYVGTIPGRSGRAMCLETDHTMSTFQGGAGMNYYQSDYYLSKSANGWSSDIWLQYWVYINNYGTQLSRFKSGRDKFWYPIQSNPTGSYPDIGSIQYQGRDGYEYQNPAHPYYSNPDPASCYLGLEGDTCRTTVATEAPTSRLYHNLAPNTKITPNQWWLVKQHIKQTSPTGAWEAWLRPMGTLTWTKVADWRPGITSGFTWDISPSAPYAQGIQTYKFPTTMNGGATNTEYPNWRYYADFAIASSESGLPTYGSY